MAQAGIHGLVGFAFRKVQGRKEWLFLGILLGSLFPDMDNLAVALATLAKLPTPGLHRTLTHSVVIMIILMLLFYLLGLIRKDQRWTNLGIGFGLGMLLHSLLDLLIWFNGVMLFWPVPLWINLWANTTPPDWFMKLMDPAEYLFLALYLWILLSTAYQKGMDIEFQKTSRMWSYFEILLFIVFTPLAFILTKGFVTINGVFYLFSLFMAFFVTIRMRKTVEAMAA